MNMGAVLILAAGGSTRMGAGRDKLAEQINGTALLTRSCERAKTLGLHIYACLPNPNHSRVALLPDGVQPIWVPDAAEGMGASIRTGIRALAAHHDAVMILPADMPDLTADDLQTVYSAHQAGQITRAVSENATPGHPVVFPQECFADLQKLTGDEGARSVIKHFQGTISLVPLPKAHALTDLDTPDAWDKWRSEHPEA